MERGRCSWVDGQERCPATDDLIRHRPRFNADRLLCPTHLREATAAAQRRETQSAASPRP